MKHLITPYPKKKPFPLNTFSIVILLFLLTGLIIVSGFDWTKPRAASAEFAESRTPIHVPSMPGSFADLAQILSPTVVNIKATKVEKVRGFQMPQAPDGPFGEFFERFFREMPPFPDQHPVQGAGSGVIISSDGYILTNNHVVEGAKELTVTLNNKEEFKARIIGRDPKTDLAVLKIETDEPLPAAVMGDSKELRVGEWVIAIGNPFGLNHTVTSGIVSAKGRIIGSGPYDDFIQTDASINPGNSGGPLFNMKGELVGINTAVIPQGQGIGFAIPVNTAKPLIPQLVSKGEVTRGYLGVNIQTITPDLAKALKIKQSKGALVADVVSEGPADKAGIKRGDVIIAYNDKPVEDGHDLPQMVAATSEGEKATVKILRDGKEKEVHIKVGKLPSEVAMGDEPQQPAMGKWGLMLEDLNAGIEDRLGRKVDRGVMVVGVKPGSPADLGDIRKGDIILEVNREPVDSVKDAKKQMAKAEDEDSLLLLVNRGQGSFFVGLKS